MNKYTPLLLLLGASFETSCSCDMHEKESSPNVLLILSDDQGWGDFGFNGNEVVNTPVLDSLQQKAAHLTNFYVSPLSASTRAGILTGRDHLRTGAMSVTRSSENMDSREVTIAEVLKANNYTTGCFGKWHNGAHYPQDPNGQGFDEFIGFCAGHLTNYFDSRLQHNQEFFNCEGYITDVLTDRAIEFMAKSVENKTPFFCYLPYNAPHAPYQVPDEYYAKYAHLGSDMTPAVYAMCENVDHNIGRLLDFVAQRDIEDNTIVIFMSDNGPNNPRYNGILRGRKGQCYDGGFKVPCLIYWKGRIESIELPQVASYIDIMPTILDLCGVDSQPASGRLITGVSLRKLLQGEETALNDRYLFTHRSNNWLGLEPNDGVVFNDKYKLITLSEGKHELYDKVNDPAEQNDISELEPELLKDLVELYDQWYNAVESEYERSISRTPQVGILDTSIELPAHEATISGSTRYYTNIHGWAGDWLVDMAPQDEIYWDVIASAAADYQVTLQYSSTSPNHTISILGDDSIVELEEYKPIKIESPDRYPRVEAYEQSWGRQIIGYVHLQEGENQIKLVFDSNKIIKKGSFEIKGIEILRK